MAIKKDEHKYIYDLLDIAFLLTEAEKQFNIIIPSNKVLSFDFKNEGEYVKFANKQIKNKHNLSYNNLKVIDNNGVPAFNASERVKFYLSWWGNLASKQGAVFSKSDVNHILTL